MLEATKEQSSMATKDDTKYELARRFCSEIEKSLDDNSFLSFELMGPSAKGRQAVSFENDQLRGCFKRVTARNVQLKDTNAIQVTFKYHLATDLVKNWKREQVAANLESIFCLGDDGLSSISEQTSSEWGANRHPISTVLGIQRAFLETKDIKWELDVGFKTKKPKLKKAKQATPQTIDQSALAHDREKTVPVKTNAPFLQALGITKQDGKPKPGKSSKLRQIQKFVEIVSKLVEKANSNGDTSSQSRPISIVDMGCGRGYLTFALHAYLFDKYHTSSAPISTVGIDVRPKLVQEINGIARSLGGPFDGLNFETGTIESFLLETGTTKHAQKSTEDSCNVLIALHACDTATDDAIFAGIRQEASVICVAPCCQKELRGQINNHFAQKSMDHPMADVLRYGIYRERMTETVTDSIRAVLLELMGYDVNVFEFIGGEHTSKNVMITAVKKSSTSQIPADDLRSRLKTLAKFYGVSYQKLATWLGEQLPGEDDVKRTRTKQGLPLM